MVSCVSIINKSSSSRVSSPVSSQQNKSIFGDQVSTLDNETKLLDTDYLQYSETSNSFKNQNSSSIKWSCIVCTYLNWPKSKHCIQCLTIKQSQNDSITPENEEKLKFGCKETVNISNIASEKCLASNNVKSPTGSTTNLASSKDIAWNEMGKNKWICQVRFYPFSCNKW